MARRPTVISLYSGAGGLDYGFEASGFDTRVALEWDPMACRTLRANRPWQVVEDDIHQVSTSAILSVGRLSVGEVDLVVGGPPCQPFSKSGYWSSGDTRRLDDPRASTLGAYLRVVDETRPKALLLENVEGLAYNAKSEGLDLLLRGIEDINRRHGTNYRPSFKVLSAADFGVPQIRKRFFLVAARDGTEFRFPAPTHGDGTPEAWRTAWDAIGDLADPVDEDLAVRGKWADLLPSIPEGHNYLFHTERGGGEPLFGWRRRYWSFLLKLSKRQPSWTIQAQPGPAIGPFHWNSRLLSSRELCRIQTFPDDVVVQGSRGAVQKQVGNAVPSLMAEVLARQIRTQLLGRRAPAGAPRLMPPQRASVPPPVDVRRVPSKFLHLRGDHSPHPGTAKRERVAVAQHQLEMHWQGFPAIQGHG